MIPKPLNIVLPTGSAAATVLDRKDSRIIELATILMFVTLGLWVFDLYLTHQTDPGLWGLGLGGAVFLVGAAMTEWNELI